jgi:SNF2 family DNA or RNA helicase
MKQIDNVHVRFVDELKSSLRKGSKLSITAASFSIYAYQELKEELEKVDGVRFVFSTPRFVEEKLGKESPHFYIPDIYREAALCGGDFELRLKNQLNQRAIARECSQWVAKKVQFKSNKDRTEELNHITHVENGDESSSAFLNVNYFTTADLGTSNRRGFPVLIQKAEYPESKAYLGWFEQVWSNTSELEDVTERIQQYFEQAYRENSPEFIYYVTLYNIFSDFLEDIAAENIPNEQIGFKETLIWRKLYNFQRDAVIGAINKLEKYKGCILADSVGLGKTFSALGVIKYYEMRNKDVLVLCPKKLEANWNTYRYNDRNNSLAEDRFRYDVLFHTDLSRNAGMSNGRNLETVNWGNYGLVVIDESHNFRNNDALSDRDTRYQRLMNRVIREGIETRVLMLSATPVNNRFKDLKNQLSLAYEGNPEKINAKLDTQGGIDQIFRRAQTAFNAWSRLDVEQRTTESLLDMLDFDFFEVLDALTIARSRKHITTYYDTTDIGHFPARNKPVALECPLTDDESIRYEHIADQLGLLNLCIYTPLSYLLPSRVQKYAELYDKRVREGLGSFSQIDRERSLRILMRINFLKRLESSVDSFRITLDRVIQQIRSAKAVISKSGLSTFESPESDFSSEEIDWESDWGEEETFIGRKVKVDIADMDLTKWSEDLDSDLSILDSLFAMVADINPERDIKLQQLLQLLDEKIKNPFNAGNKKAIVFTAFADTAEYLYRNLQGQLLGSYQLHSALITGQVRKTNSKQIPTELNTLLTCFSPISKEKELVYPNIKDSIDLLIATDCISEGQNLQDCDYLINYDIHWNPVRIVQRFGRIDRIGSKNNSITMVNFWPDTSLDSYINLKQRVENRMLITNMAGTGDDNLLNAQERDLEYRKIQLNKLKEEVVDLEDLREGVSITDLGLNDFRIDLSNFIKQYGELKHVPEGVHAVVPSDASHPPGCLFVLKNVNTTVNIDKLNRLHPYYLVYINQDGQVKYSYMEPKKILDAFRMFCKGEEQPIKDICDNISRKTDDYHDMDDYSMLLKRSIASILRVEEEKDVKSLFNLGGTTALRDKIKGIEDFKLISFLIIA